MSRYIGDVSAYALAVSQGYTGTEEEYAELMASYATVGQTAVAAAQTATTKASEAATSATTATNKASEATTAAQTATTKAGEASTSASTATSAKDTAVSASQTATTKATEATTAAATATSAKTDAVAANTAAQSAKTAAQTAQQGAETARDAVQSSAAQITTNAEDITQLKEDLTTKANTDGYYADLVSGGSTQLLSDMVETDTTPYNYRTAGGALEIGDRMKLKEIVGLSLPINQLVKNGNFDGTTNWSASSASISASNNILTVTKDVDKGTGVGYVKQSGLKFTIGHKYFAAVDYKAASGDTITLFSNSGNCGMLQIDSIADENWHTVRKVFNCAAEPSVPAILWINTITTDSTRSVQFRNFNIFDLTQMFGSTIADYVYTLESGTAGTGVAWLKKYFSKIFDGGYIPYNEGAMQHVTGLSASKTVGFNQWDEEWESGRFDTATGAPTAHSGNIRTVNPIKILPNTSYCVRNNKRYFRVLFYDANDVFVSAPDLILTGNTKTVITTPDGIAYMRFFCDSTTYKNDICINLHWDGELDGTYKPYEEHVYALPSDETYRGILKIDANGVPYADGDRKLPDGTINRRYGIVDLGTLEWAYVSANNCFYAPYEVNSVRGGGNYGYKYVCTRYIYGASMQNLWDGIGEGLCVEPEAISATKRIYVRDAKYTDAATFKTAMNGVYLVHELAEPTTEEGTPYTEEQITNNWGTEELVSTTLVPVGHVTDYHPDLRAKVEASPESPDTDGLYLMKRENGQNSYVAYLGELPSDPTTDGTYTLKCTVASGVATKTWEADT